MEGGRGQSEVREELRRERAANRVGCSPAEKMPWGRQEESGEKIVGQEAQKREKRR